jgi:hypothetical protein
MTNSNSTAERLRLSGLFREVGIELSIMNLENNFKTARFFVRYDGCAV